MSFWNKIMVEMNDDDGADRVNGKMEIGGHSIGFWSSIDEIAEKSTRSEWLAFAQLLHESSLPTEAINESIGKCETCNTEGILGNGLCVDCWDYVVDFSSASAKEWPDTKQYKAIKLAHS